MAAEYSLLRHIMFEISLREISNMMPQKILFGAKRHKKAFRRRRQQIIRF
jgi:hypothetical protein